MKKTLKYIKAHKVISSIILIAIIGVGYFTYTKLHSSTITTQYVFGKVQRGDLVVSVSGTGQVATLSKVDIKPQTTGQTQTLGQIIKVNVINGQTVKAGDVVAILDGKTALQSVNQARSSVASAQANYDKLVNGPTASDLQGNNSSVQNATISLQNSLQNISTKLQSVYLTVSNSILVSTDVFYSRPAIVPARWVLNVSDVSFRNHALERDVQDERADIEPILQFLKELAGNFSLSDDPAPIVKDVVNKLTTVRNYFDEMTTLFALYSNGDSSAGESTVNSSKSAASSARSSTNSAINDMVSALQTYQSSVVSLAQASTSLSFKVAPANPNDLVVSQAQLDNAKANLANAQETYASRIITAPFNGQIGGLNAQIGQQVSSSDVLGTIITPQKVVNVSLNEVDAAKVSAGNPVVLTFDALPNLTINGKVSFVDPLGTVTQGVVNYSVQISMTDQNDQIKTGMTATAAIITVTHSNVLLVPTAAITKVGNRSVVLVPNDVTSLATSTFPNNFAGFASSTASSAATTTDTSTRTRGAGSRNFGATGTTATAQSTTATVHAVPVIVGISNDTMTEIISGLNEGDAIVTRTITGTTGATAASTARAGSIFGVGGAGGGAVRTGGNGGGGGGGRISG